MKETLTKKNKNLGFNDVIGWFGQFTPQFKNYLAHFQRKMSPQEFNIVAKDIFSFFRKNLYELSQIPKGAERAKSLHEKIDYELAQQDASKISCKKGCAFCCHSEKQIMDDEADRLVHWIQNNDFKIDREKLKAQASIYQNGANWPLKISSQTRCVFLGSEDACQVYENRPAVCRKHQVTSPPENCATPMGNVEAQSELLPEILVSAALSLPDNKLGPMPIKILERL